MSDFELIIVDDCSQDQTPAIIDEFAQADSRIKVIRNKQNRKLPTSLNIGFAQACGVYHTWTSDDNVYSPTALEEMLGFLENHRHTDIVYCDYVKADQQTGQAREWIVKDIDYIGRGNPVGACFMYKSQVFNTLKGYDEDLFCVEDYDFWLRAYRNGFKFSPLHKKLYIYRCHGGSLTETRKEQIQAMASKLNENHFREIAAAKKQPVFQGAALRPAIPISPSSHRKKVAIWGWWQGKNLGDNWIKKTLAGFFPDAVFIDTCEHNFERYDFIICGGGGLFIRGVIPPWNRSPRVPFGMLGLGAEFAHPDGNARDLAAKAEFFYLRDEYSVACMGVDPSARSYDLTFARPLPMNSDPDFNKAFFVWRNPDKLFAYPDFKKYIGVDGEYSTWKTKLSGEFSRIEEDNFSTEQCGIEQLVSNCGFVISARYHGIVAAIQRGVPCIGIDLCPKIRSLMREVGLEEYCLKVGETGAIRHLIRKAKKEHLAIRKKEIAYCSKARETVLGHINSCVISINNNVRQQMDPDMSKTRYEANNSYLAMSLS
jgi:glycosyltransferase involved in cell wall biosynthesis